MFVPMETREDFLLKLATVLDDVGSNQKLIIRDRCIERACSVLTARNERACGRIRPPQK